MEKIELKHTLPNCDYSPEYKTVYESDDQWAVAILGRAGQDTAAFRPNTTDQHIHSIGYLYAAAPLLLSALMEAVEDAEDMKDLAEHQFPDQGPYEHPKWYHKAKAAIAKATNTTQP
jgi:hypothetical protein